MSTEAVKPTPRKSNMEIKADAEEAQCRQDLEEEMERLADQRVKHTRIKLLLSLAREMLRRTKEQEEELEALAQEQWSARERLRAGERDEDCDKCSQTPVGEVGVCQERHVKEATQRLEDAEADLQDNSERGTMYGEHLDELLEEFDRESEELERIEERVVTIAGYMTDLDFEVAF